MCLSDVRIALRCMQGLICSACRRSQLPAPISSTNLFLVAACMLFHGRKKDMKEDIGGEAFQSKQLLLI